MVPKNKMSLGIAVSMKELCLIYFLNNFEAHTRYKVKAEINIAWNSMAITGHKNAANMTPQHKHTEKH